MNVLMVLSLVVMLSVKLKLLVTHNLHPPPQCLGLTGLPVLPRNAGTPERRKAGWNNAHLRIENILKLYKALQCLKY